MNIFYLIYLFTIFFLLGSLPKGYADSHAQSLLPKFLNTLNLGIEESSLLSSRPNITVDPFFTIPGQEKSYGEKLIDHTYFDGAGYGVKDRKISFVYLAGPRLNSTYPLKPLYKALLNWAFETYGQDYRVHVADGPPHPQPNQEIVFQWENKAENVIIALAIPTFETVDATIVRKPDSARVSMRYRLLIYDKESIIAPIFINQPHSKFGDQKTFIERFMGTFNQIDATIIPSLE